MINDQCEIEKLWVCNEKSGHDTKLLSVNSAFVCVVTTATFITLNDAPKPGG